MNPILRNILAVITGLIVGSAVNMGIVSISEFIIPPPDGTDMSTMEGLKAAMPLYEAKHFIFPFLAHALGTLVGAFLAALIAVNNKIKFALAIGVWFLIGGIAMVYLIPSSPISFILIDLLLAYIPMAWIGWKLADK